MDQSDERDIPLIANNYLFSNGPDLFDNQFADRLHEAIDSAHTADLSLQGSENAVLRHPSRASADGAYSDNSYDTFKDIDFDDGQTNLASLPDQPMPQPYAQQMGEMSFGLAFDQTLSQYPPTIAPAAILNNKSMPQLQIQSNSGSAPDSLFTWHPMSTNSVIPITGGGQQQQWPVFANQQLQLLQPQPTLAQVQYMQAVQQFQFAQNQLALTMQPPFQSPTNAQSPPNQQSIQASQKTHSLPPQTLPSSRESEPAQYIQALLQNLPRITPIDATPPEPVPSLHNALQADVERPSKQQEEPTSPPRPRKARANRTSDSASDAHTLEQPYSGLMFTSLREAEAAMPARYLEKDWRAPSPDDTIPHTDKDQAYWVLKLLNALRDTSKCKDNKDGFSFLKRWRHALYYNEQEMEKVCWHMLDIAVRLHEQGPSATNIYCHDALKKMHASRNLTFEQRIVAICDMLKLSKFLCDNLMKGEGIEALVGAPKQKMSGAKTMMIQNQKRQTWLEKGRGGSKGKTKLPEDNEQDVIVNMADVSQLTQHQPKQKPMGSSKPQSRTIYQSRKLTADDSKNEDVDAELSRSQSIVDTATNESDHTNSPMPTSAPALPSHSPTRPSRMRGLGALIPGRGHGRPSLQLATTWSKTPMGKRVKSNTKSRKHAIDLKGSDSDEETSAHPTKRTRGRKDVSKKRSEGPVRRKSGDAEDADTDEDGC